MKFLISAISVAIFTLMLQVFLPWWSLAIGAFIVGVITNQKASGAFLSGFFGVASVWWGYAFFLDVETQSILSIKIAQILPFAFGEPLLLLLITGLVGGLVGAFASLSGCTLRKVFWNK